MSWVVDRRRLSVVAMSAGMLLLGSAFYCRLDGTVYGNSAPDALTAWAWAVQVSAAWIAVAAVVVSSNALRSHLVSRTGLQFCTAVVLVANVSEWLLGHAGYAAGLFDNARSLLEIAYERTPLAAAGAAVIALACRQGCSSSSRAAVADAGAATTLEVLTASGRCIVSLQDVERFTAAENYVQVHHVSGRTYLLRTTMERLARTLDAAQFVRVHRSVIVSRMKIVERRRGNELVLASGEIVHIGRTYRGSV